MGARSFLFGPRRQCKNMTRAKRRYAAALYISMMIITIVLGCLRGPGLIILLCVFLQWCALIWYLASYIPYGQKMLTKVLGSATGF